MSEEGKSTEDNPSMPPGNAEEVKNLKAEFGRKFENLQSSFDESLTRVQQALSELKPADPAPAVDDDIDLYSDPDRYLKKREEELFQRFESQQREKDAKNAALSQLASEFPELSDSEHAMTKKLLEYLPGVKNINDVSPDVLMSKVYQAASVTGTRPASSRRSDEFNFNGTQGVSGKKPSREKDEELSDISEQWASIMEEALGKKLNRDNIKAHSKRRKGKFSRYAEVKPSKE